MSGSKCQTFCTRSHCEHMCVLVTLCHRETWTRRSLRTVRSQTNWTFWAKRARAQHRLSGVGVRILSATFRSFRQGFKKKNQQTASSFFKEIRFPVIYEFKSFSSVAHKKHKNDKSFNAFVYTIHNFIKDFGRKFVSLMRAKLFS